MSQDMDKWILSQEKRDIEFDDIKERHRERHRSSDDSLEVRTGTLKFTNGVVVTYTVPRHSDSEKIEVDLVSRLRAAFPEADLYRFG